MSSHNTRLRSGPTQGNRIAVSIDPAMVTDAQRRLIRRGTDIIAAIAEHEDAIRKHRHQLAEVAAGLQQTRGMPYRRVKELLQYRGNLAHLIDSELPERPPRKPGRPRT